MSYLSDQLREHGPAFGLTHLCDEAADALDANDARIAELEAQAALTDLFDVLMRQNIETSDESYLSLKCVGVPPTKVEFVAAVQCALAVYQSASGGTK